MTREFDLVHPTMKIGRNDPCHCGSGAKYKRCCLAKDQAANVIDHEMQRFRHTEREVIQLLLFLADEWYGPDFMNQAWQEYTETYHEPLQFEETPEAETSFIAWALFNYIHQQKADADPQHEVPLAFLYVMVADEVNPDVKRFILEASRSPMSFWSVQEVDPGASLSLRDIFRHIDRTVTDRQAAELLRKGDVVYTRVVSLGQTTEMFGVAPVFFPPRYHVDLLNARDVLFGPRRKISILDLQEFEPALRQLYFGLRGRRLNPRSPILENTDGDPFEFTKFTYRLNCSPQTALEKLRSLNLEAEEQLLTDATWDESGELQTLTFSWMKSNNENRPSWDNTIMGHLTIADGNLIVDVNSKKRSETIQTEITKRLADDAVLLDTVSESIEEVFARIQEAADSGELQPELEDQAALSAMPEVQALIKDTARKHWDRWLNVPLPLLMGKTPRQASKTVGGRERLEALLVDFERGAETDNSAFAPDVMELRRKLRMLPGDQNQKEGLNKKDQRLTKAMTTVSGADD